MRLFSPLPCCGPRFSLRIANSSALSAWPSGHLLPSVYTLLTAPSSGSLSQFVILSVGGEGSLEIFPTSCKYYGAKNKFPLRSRCSGMNGGDLQSISYVIVLKRVSLKEFREWFESFHCFFAFVKPRYTDPMAGRWQWSDRTSGPSASRESSSSDTKM